MLARTDTDPDNIARLRDAVVEGGGLDEAGKVMHSLIARAQSMLYAYPTSPYHNSLLKLASYAADRRK
jgi:geranylgeranyl pyrophosphate synthase